MTPWRTHWSPRPRRALSAAAVRPIPHLLAQPGADRGERRDDARVAGHHDVVPRRELLRRAAGTAAVIAGGGLVAACAPPAANVPSYGATLPPPEVTTVRFVNPSACDPPAALAKPFLLKQAFTDITYVRVPATTEWLTKGLAAFSSGYGNLIATNVDLGQPSSRSRACTPGASRPQLHRDRS
jgi:hypothetical protein